MAENIKVKLNKQELKEIPLKEEKDDKKKYDIQIVDDQTIEFTKLEDGQKSEGEVKIKFRECGKGAEYGSEKTVKLICKQNFLRTKFVLDETIDTGVELKKEEMPRVKTDKHTYRLGAYGIGLVVILAIVGFIWWWIASSKKEDKEEESL